MPPPLSRTIALAPLILLASAAVAAGQPLVLQKGSSRDYHNPWCPVVRDGKGVIAITLAQASARGFTVHAACARDPAGEGMPAAAVFVHVDASKYYHRAGCAKRARTHERQALATAARTRWPCPACRPPIRKSGS